MTKRPFAMVPLPALGGYLDLATIKTGTARLT